MFQQYTWKNKQTHLCNISETISGTQKTQMPECCLLTHVTLRIRGCQPGRRVAVMGTTRMYIHPLFGFASWHEVCTRCGCLVQRIPWRTPSWTGTSSRVQTSRAHDSFPAVSSMGPSYNFSTRYFCDGSTMCRRRCSRSVWIAS